MTRVKSPRGDLPHSIAWGAAESSHSMGEITGVRGGKPPVLRSGVWARIIVIERVGTINRFKISTYVHVPYYYEVYLLVITVSTVHVHVHVQYILVHSVPYIQYYRHYIYMYRYVRYRMRNSQIWEFWSLKMRARAERSNWHVLVIHKSR